MCCDRSAREFPLYGLSPDFDGSFLAGKTLELVCFGAQQVYLHFSSDVLITIESAFSCRQKAGAPVTRTTVPVLQSDLMTLLGRSVVRALGDGDGTLSIEFDDGRVLACYDTSQEYESYSIRHGDRIIHV